MGNEETNLQPEATESIMVTHQEKRILENLRRWSKMFEYATFHCKIEVHKSRLSSLTADITLKA